MRKPVGGTYNESVKGVFVIGLIERGIHLAFFALTRRSRGFGFFRSLLVFVFFDFVLPASFLHFFRLGSGEIDARQLFALDEKAELDLKADGVVNGVFDLGADVVVQNDVPVKGRGGNNDNLVAVDEIVGNQRLDPYIINDIVDLIFQFLAYIIPELIDFHSDDIFPF